MLAQGVWGSRCHTRYAAHPADMPRTLSSRGAGTSGRHEHLDPTPRTAAHSTYRDSDSWRLSASGSGLTETQIRDEKAALDIVDRAAATIGRMLDEIQMELSLCDDAHNRTASLDAVEAGVIERVVATHVIRLDQGFLEALDLFSQTARKQNNDDLADRLDTIKAEVLSQVTDRMPPEVRVLNTASQLLSRSDRRGVIRQAAQGGHGKLPAVDLAALWLCANQVISDMEEKEYVPDRRLLAMVCVVREEILFVAQELGHVGKDLEQAVTAQQQNLNPVCLAFLQRLMVVGDALQRQGQLAAMLRATPKESDSDVKPGQLMTAVAAMYDGLCRQDSTRADPAKAERMEAIQQELMQALTDVIEKG